MRVIRTLTLAFSLVVCSLLAFSAAQAQETVGISVDVEPPPLPVYDQPPIPAPGYLWVPGYWAWDDDTGYYWVPGTWVLPPEPELLWTPGYWGWSDGVYLFHDGYWGPQIGFYGGVAYGFGYTGDGYEGGYWRNGAFFYNQSVNNISNVSITNVYNKTVVVNNTSNVSYNGGTGGTTAKPTPEQLAAEKERHVAPTAEQTHNVQAAAKDPTLSLNNNHGHPTVAATAHPAQFKGPGVVAAHPGKPVAAVQPQGHRVVGPGNAATTPGNKTGPAITTPGTKVGRSARRQPLPPRRSARKSVSIKAPAAVAHRPVPGWLIHRRRRHRGPRHRRHRRAPPHIRHLRRAPLRRRPRGRPPHHRRRELPRRRRGRQHQPPSPSASRVNTAELCRAGFPLPRERETRAA